MLAAPAGTVTLAGTTMIGSPAVKPTTAPPEPATAVNDTVHVPFMPVAAVTGVHVSDDSVAVTTGAGGTIVNPCETPR